MASKTARRALGRGLTNLIPQDTVDGGSGNEVVEVDLGSIQANPFQPRREFPAEEIGALAESIRTQGLLQPILLRKRESGYQIISGERRFRALQVLGRRTAPAIVKAGVADREMLEMALVENLQRADLNEIEKARGYERLLLECGLSHDDLAKRVGMSRSVVSNALRLLRLPDDIQEMVRSGSISGGHARALAGIDDEARQRLLAKRIIAEQLSVRAVERILNADAAAGGRKRKARRRGTGEGVEAMDADTRSVVERIRYRFGTQVEIMRDAKGHGSVRLAFYSDADLKRVLGLLDGSQH